jgi:alkanesulfonate monooxygenase SsuD/methylene tetrahydromethanopterin reductase-like flavin-dependent oxidoreductase (luciferase family)
VGVGGSRQEFEAVLPRMKDAHRGRLLDEQMQVLDLLFTQDDVSFNGEHFEFHGLSLHPKPKQRPLPFYITAYTMDTPDALKRMARWASLVAVHPTEQAVRNRIEGLKPYMEKAGRDVAELELTTMPTASIGRTHQEAVDRLQKSRLFERYRGQPLEKIEEGNLVGTPEEITEKIKRLEAEGLHHCGPQRFATNTYEGLKEQVQMFGEEVVPHFR